MNGALLRKYLHSIPFFAELSDAEIHFLAQQEAHFPEFRQGDVITPEGELDTTLYVLIQGMVEVFKSSKGDALAQLEPGAVFGDAAFFVAPSPRTTSIVAGEKSTIFRLDELAFRSLDPALQVKIQAQVIQILVNRLEQMNGALVKLMRMRR